MSEPTIANSNRTILVIDDDPYARDITGRLLEVLGYDVEMAPDGETGVQLFREHSSTIHAVILDCQLPGKNGDEVFHELRRIDRNIPIILCTSCRPRDPGCDCPEKEVTDFLEKPVSYDHLAEVIGKVIRH